MTLTDEVLEKYRRAGRIAAEVRRRVAREVKAGVPIIQICERAERFIRMLGGQPAFPCNVSVNEVAAHYTSPPNDTRHIPEGALVKVDIGVHVDGYIADTATTVCLNPEYEYLVKAAEAALKRAVESIHAGMKTGELGSIIEKTIKLYGCKPISNLTGHKIDRYTIHAGVSIPNVAHRPSKTIDAVGVYAIEPFTTLKGARGLVREGREMHIFRFLRRKPLTNPRASHLLEFIIKHYRTLPFAERWLWKRLPRSRYRDAFKELVVKGCIMGYRVFIEESGMPVAQAEHTVIVMDGGCIVIT